MLSVLVLLSRFCLNNKDKHIKKAVPMEEKIDALAKPHQHNPEVYPLSYDVASNSSSMHSSASSTSSTETKMSKTQPEQSLSKVITKMEPVNENNYKDLNPNHHKETESLMETITKVLQVKDLRIDDLERQVEKNRKSDQDFTSLSQTNEEITTLQVSLKNAEASISDLTKRLEEKDIESIGLKADLGRVKQFSHHDVRTVGTSTTNQSYNQDMSASFSGSSPSEYTSLPMIHDNENRQLRETVRKLNLTVDKLKDMNMKWQNYNDQREVFVKQLGEENEQLKQIVRQLTEQNDQLSASTSSRNAGVLEFTPAQQEHVDRIYQKLRSDVDKQKELLEITKNESQKNLAAERKLKEEALTTVQELSTKVTEQEAKINDLYVQNDELKSALVVATRSHDYTSQAEQESTINSLREAARQYELDFAKLQEEHSRARQQISNLEAQLRRSNLMTGAVTRTSNPVMSQSFSAGRSWYEDIETDVPTSGNFQARRSVPDRLTPNSANNISPSM
uniref:Alpha3-fucosyltransferase n=1 Tax=Phallusia mammillata TaxID=59560 RepID=A0A6F9DD57_9ASCI|nr:alpha3-fucosyltransferase [Phallusia mammillata]